MTNYSQSLITNNYEPEENTWVEFDKDDDDDLDLSLFDDPDPFDTFHLKFTVHDNWRHDEITKETNINSIQTNTETEYKNKPKHKKIIYIKLEGIKKENCQTISSTGLTLWGASTLLCDFLCHNVHLIQRNDILEIGSGLGLCGMVAYKLGARRVIMTEGDTNVLDQMRKNVNSNVIVTKNFVCQIEHVDKNIQPCLNILPCRQLKWGLAGISDFREKWCCTPIPKRSNSNISCLNVGFDVIMGSDIIYAEDIIEPLFDTVTGLLSSSSHAIFLLAYIRRNVKIDLVLNCAKRRGFLWKNSGENMCECVYIFQWS